MPLTNKELSDKIIHYLIEIAHNRCDLNVEYILEQEEEWYQEILFGLLNLHEDLQYNKSQAEKAINTAIESRKVKEDFLANMSHEIRTPMNAVLGFTSLLAESGLDESQLKMVNTIKSAGIGLLNILNDILDFSKIESGKLNIEQVDFDIMNNIDPIIVLMGSKAKEKGLKLLVMRDSEVPQMVNGDPTRLNQVLMNLIGNAIKFTQDGEISLSIKVLDQGSQNVTLRFSVSDTGIGIAEEHLNTIFESFTQAEKYTTRKFGGTGLGLSISQSLIELQGGKLMVESELGKGSTFSFDLEYGKVDQDSIDTALENNGSEPIVKGMKVLVCEDNEMNQLLLKAIFDKRGVEYEIANDGEEGIDKLKSGNEFDIVLMDLQMPNKNGYEAATDIRKTMNSDIPIIAMSAHSFIEENEKCIEHGMNDYITKPFDEKDFIRKIAGYYQAADN